MPFDQFSTNQLHVPLHTFNTQVAAIPLRWMEGRAEVLLVTTRGRRHWTVPKGWPLDHSMPAACAAREAYEEAGVVGEVERYSLGAYDYWKKSKQGRLVLRVTAFAMHVERLLADWPERGARKRVWFSPDAAARLTGNTELSALIRAAAQVKFTPNAAAREDALLAFGLAN